MAVSTWSIQNGFNGGSSFSNFCSYIASALASVGWVRVSPAGNFANAPSTSNQTCATEIWRMDDSLQSSAPIFLGIAYGSSSSYQNPGIWVALGTEVNESTWTLVRGTSYLQIAMSGTWNVEESWISGSSSRLTSSLFLSCGFFAVERTHDGTGADTADGAMLLVSSNGPSPVRISAYLPATGTIPPSQAGWNCLTPLSGNGTVLSNVYMFPIRCWTPGESSPFLGISAYFPGDIATATIQAMDWAGNSHTFKATGKILGPSTTISFGGLTVGAIRYD